MTTIVRRLGELSECPYRPDEKVVALTFDDAPAVNTEAVLDALARCEVAATFFVVGRSVENRPDLVRRIADEGHVVGNHSWSHPRLEELDDAAIVDEFTRTGTVVADTIGTPVQLVRPPYSMQHADRLARLLAPHGYRAVVGWSVDPEDWSDVDAATVAARVVTDLKPGAIVLLHAGPGRNRPTATAVPWIVEAVRDLGYRFVTI